jgi:DNA polymerase III subunit gamma/tau
VEAPSLPPAPAVRGGEKRRSASTRSTAPRGGRPSRAPVQDETGVSSSGGSPKPGDGTSPESDPAVATKSQSVDPLPPLELAKAREVWPELIKKVGANLGWRLIQVEPVAAVGADLLVIAAKPGYNSMAEVCGTPDALVKIGQGLQRLIHRPIKVRYERSSDSSESASDSRPSETSRAESVAADPMVQKVMELFEAKSYHTDVDDPDERPGS